MKGLIGICIICPFLLFTACQKADEPVVLPPQGDAVYSAVEMGEDYRDQLFFDFETNSVVHVSEINSWDLAFDASAAGFHVFMNGGGDVFVYNTHETDFSKVTVAPEEASKEWLFDRPCGLPDSTAIGDWRNKGGFSGSEIYIVKLNETKYGKNHNIKKMRLVLTDGSRYVLEYADINEGITHTIEIPKDGQYNYSYFSFADGGKVVQPDPPKAAWDIVFTRYRYIYYDLDNFPYMVNGVLTNPYNTTTAVDSGRKFTEIGSAHLAELEFTNHRDVIGFNWKAYNFKTEHYDIKPDMNYVIRNRNGQYWKLHFLDFYNKQGIKGSPSFEFQRVN